MKAISLRQPWADLVVQGSKTIELRTWKVDYRGKLAIHASQSINTSMCHKLGINPDVLTTGAILGTVELTDIKELEKDEFDQLADKHLAMGVFLYKKPIYGWYVESPHAFERPIPFHGRMGLFNVPDNLVLNHHAESIRKTIRNDHPFDPTNIVKPEEWYSQYSFELQVVPETDSRLINSPYRLALFQRLTDPNSLQMDFSHLNPVKMTMISELGGKHLKSIADQILEILKLNGYQATDLSLARKESFTLSEETGVRLGLLFLAIRPLTKPNRMEQISYGLRSMTVEEIYYWFSKCTNPATSDRAQKAFRILLSDE